MGLKEHGCLVAGLFSCFFGQNAELFDRFGLGRLEAFPFRLAVRDLVALERGVGALIKVKRSQDNSR